MITRHGKTVALLVPPRSMTGDEQAHAAAAALRTMSRGVKLGGLSIREARSGRPAVSLVVDASLTLAWCFEDERTPAIDAVLDQVVRDRALVPSLWRLEVVNGLQMAMRRKRIDGMFATVPCSSSVFCRS